MNPEPKDSDEKLKQGQSLSDEISADELAMLLGDDTPSFSSAGSQSSGSESMDDLISAEELAAIELSIGGGSSKSQSTHVATGAQAAAIKPAVAQPMAAAAKESTMTQPTATATATPSPPKYDGLTPTSDHADIDTGIDLLLDVPLKVSVELGRIIMTLQQILGLGRGSIIELERLAGEPVDILVNDKLIAHGEVVVVDEYFGVKITELIEPKG